MNLIPNPKMPIKVIFEDNFVLVIEKQAGIPVYPLKDGETETLANGIVAKWPLLVNVDPIQVGFMHRLDNDTSGLMLIAKTVEASQNIRAQFDEHTIQKHYTALVLGEPPPQGVIESPIIHDAKNAKRMRVCNGTAKEMEEFRQLKPAPQDAWTGYKLLKKFLGGRYSLVEVHIKTGVRHQIRAHMASIGHPLAGDHLYQNARSRKLDMLGLKRQFLHASKLGFEHPETEEWVAFESPLPPDLQNVLKKL